MCNALISLAVKPSAEDRIYRVLVSRSAFLSRDLRFSRAHHCYVIKVFAIRRASNARQTRQSRARCPKSPRTGDMVRYGSLIRDLYYYFKSGQLRFIAPETRMENPWVSRALSRARHHRRGGISLGYELVGRVLCISAEVRSADELHLDSGDGYRPPEIDVLRRAFAVSMRVDAYQ